MATERESFQELNNKFANLTGSVSRVDAFTKKIGETDIDPELRLDATNLSQYAKRFQAVTEINRAIKGVLIPRLNSQIDEVAVQIVGKVDDEITVAGELFEEIKQAVNEDLLSKGVLSNLEDRIKELRGYRDSLGYRTGMSVLEERKKQEEAPVIAERSQKLQIIRENLGNPNAFEFPAGMTTKQLYEIDGSNTGRTIINTSIYNALARSGIRAVEDLLSKSAADLVGDPRRKGSGIRGFGPKSLEITLEQLLKAGILPKEQIDEQIPAKKFSRGPSVCEIKLPDETEAMIKGEAKAAVLRELILAPNNTLTSGELAQRTYGKDTPENRGKVTHAIFYLRKDLAGKYQIDKPVTPNKRATGEDGFYTLKKIDSQPRLTAGQNIESSFDPSNVSPLATVQRLVDSGILTNPDVLRQAREAAREAYGFIKLSEPSVEVTESNNNFLHLREETFAALYLIMRGSPGLTAGKIIETMGEINGRKYTWVETVNSMFMLSKTLAEIIRREVATQWHLQLWQEVKEYSQVPENDPYVIRVALKDKVTTWFKERL